METLKQIFIETLDNALGYYFEIDINIEKATPLQKLRALEGYADFIDLEEFTPSFYGGLDYIIYQVEGLEIELKTEDLEDTIHMAFSDERRSERIHLRIIELAKKVKKQGIKKLKTYLRKRFNAGLPRWDDSAEHPYRVLQDFESLILAEAAKL